MRYIHTSKDKGKTWLSRPDAQLIDPSCTASIIRYSSKKEGVDKNRLIFSNLNLTGKRENLTIRISCDEGKTWSKGKMIYKGSSAYASMTVLKNGDVGLFFEKDNYKENAFVRFPLERLTDGIDTLN